jgi:hypothetical protein
MQYIVRHEGQDIPVPEEIASDEGKLRRSLSSIIPGIAEAKINQKIIEGDITTITIVKTAGSKGAADPAAYLAACLGGINPLIACYEAVETVDLFTLSAAEAIALEQRINKAAEKGGQQLDAMKRAAKRLQAASPQPSPIVILGF